MNEVAHHFPDRGRREGRYELALRRCCHGLKTTTGKTGIYKILVNQTARLMNEFGRENIEIFDKLEDAKEVVLLIVKRYEEAAKQNHHQISYRPDPRIEMLRAEMSELTEDRVEAFFI